MSSLSVNAWRAARRLSLLGALCLCLSGCATQQEKDLERAQAMYEQRRYDVALQVYEGILRQDPGQADAQRGYARSAQALVAQWRELSARAQAQGDWLSAVRYAGRSQQLLPGHPEAYEFAREVVLSVRPQADALREQGSYGAALELYLALDEQVASLAQLDAGLIPGLKAQWRDALAASAAQDERAGRWGVAYLSVSKALQLQDRVEDRVARERLRQQIVAQHAMRVAFAPLRAGEGVAHVTARLRAHAWPLGLVVDPVQAPVVARYELGEMTCQDRERVEPREHRHVLGQEVVENPEFVLLSEEGRSLERREAKAREHEQQLRLRAQQCPTPASRECQRAQSAADSARQAHEQLSQELAEVSAQLGRTPPTITRDIERFVTYDLVSVTRRCTSWMRGALSHPVGVSPLDYALAREAHDVTHVGIPEMALAHDPLVLPDVEQLRGQLYDEAFMHIERPLLGLLAQRREELASQALATPEARGRQDLLITAFLLHPQASPSREQALIVELSELPDALELLRLP